MTNFYSGELLKQPPIKKEIIAKALGFDKMPYYRISSPILPRLALQAYPSCCAIAILSGTGNNMGDDSSEYDGYFLDNPEILSKAVWSIERALDYWLQQWRVRNFGCYLITAINEHAVKTGMRDILTDYFGFAQIESDFLNIKPKDNGSFQYGPRIKIMGVNASGKFCKEDI